MSRRFGGRVSAYMLIADPVVAMAVDLAALIYLDWAEKRNAENNEVRGHIKMIELMVGAGMADKKRFQVNAPRRK